MLGDEDVLAPATEVLLRLQPFQLLLFPLDHFGFLVVNCFGSSSLISSQTSQLASCSSLM